MITAPGPVSFTTSETTVPVIVNVFTSLVFVIGELAVEVITGAGGGVLSLLSTMSSVGLPLHSAKKIVHRNAPKRNPKTYLIFWISKACIMLCPTFRRYLRNLI